MRRLSLVVVVCAAATAPWSLAHAQTATQILAAGCTDDAKKFCSGVPSGGGRIIACLKQNKASLSDQCKQAAARASQMAAGGAQGTSAPAADVPIAAPAAPKPAPTAAAAPSKKPTTAGAGGSYLELKKVQLTGPGPEPHIPPCRPTIC